MKMLYPKGDYKITYKDGTVATIKMLSKEVKEMHKNFFKQSKIISFEFINDQKYII